MKKKIVFVTGTRADYGKIKSILKLCIKKFNVKIYSTGMHLLPKFGNTYKEIEKSFGSKLLVKRNNQIKNSSLDIILAKTIFQFSQFIKKFNPDMILVHGDRAEAFAAAIVSSLNNILYHILKVEKDQVILTSILDIQYQNLPIFILYQIKVQKKDL